mmetsp:Transcript_28453/g.71286  ORF Transcript_28453/g.71286 Transcript_28453/m.71286 type:complete len:274 (-) Transcript_28453:1476-2297(-)
MPGSPAPAWKLCLKPPTHVSQPPRSLLAPPLLEVHGRASAWKCTRLDRRMLSCSGVDAPSAGSSLRRESAAAAVGLVEGCGGMSGPAFSLSRLSSRPGLFSGSCSPPLVERLLSSPSCRPAGEVANSCRRSGRPTGSLVSLALLRMARRALSSDAFRAVGLLPRRLVSSCGIPGSDLRSSAALTPRWLSMLPRALGPEPPASPPGGASCPAPSWSLMVSTIQLSMFFSDSLSLPPLVCFLRCLLASASAPTFTFIGPSASALSTPIFCSISFR